MYCPKCDLEIKDGDHQKCYICDSPLIESCGHDDSASPVDSEAELKLKELIDVVNKNLEETADDHEIDFGRHDEAASPDIIEPQADEPSQDINSDMSQNYFETKKNDKTNSEKQVPAVFSPEPETEAEEEISSEVLEKTLDELEPAEHAGSHPKKKFSSGVVAAFTLIAVIVIAAAGSMLYFKSRHDSATVFPKPKLATKQDEVLKKILKKADKKVLAEKDGIPALTKAPLEKTAEQENVPVKPAAGEKFISPARGYAIHTGSYKTKKFADAETERLKGLGFDAYVDAVHLNQKDSWYRVMAGRFTTIEDARTAQDELKRKDSQIYTRIMKIE